MAAATAVMTTESWEAAMAAILAKPKAIIAIVGPKASGKSSFARELFSRFRSASSTTTTTRTCCFIETDLGRPEYVFPGVISVHDAADEKLVGALFYGEDEPSQRPHEYLAQVSAVCRLASSRFDVQIINTHGWVAMGQGQDILDGLLRTAQVTDVIEIVVNDTAGTSLVRRGGEDFSLTTLTPAVNGRPRESKHDLNAKLARDLFSGTSGSVDVFAVGLAKVRLSFPQDLVDRALPFEFALLALNTSIVGMFKNGDETNPANFLGVGLVSGLDLDAQCVFVCTSVPFDVVQQCSVLVMGTTNRLEMSLFPPAEVSNSNRHHHHQQNRPYVTACNLVGFGSTTQPTKRKGLVKRRRLEG